MLASLLILLFFLFLLIFSISKWKVHPFIALLLVAIALGLSLGLGGPQTIDVLLKGFSETLRWIALIIILGSFIGEVLQETGGAFRISDKVLKWVGEKKLPWAMGFTGYIVSIPVFVDVAYILLHPVVDYLAVKSKKPVLYVGLALTAGLMVSHTLIPPTPGPMAMASLLKVEMGRMLMINLVVGLFAMAGGVLWTIFYVRKAWLPYDSELQENTPMQPEQPATGGRSVWWDFAPIVIPIVLIGLGAFLKLEGGGLPAAIFGFLSLPLVAVMVGAAIAIVQLKTPDKKTTINRLVEQAILKSALVIMITGAGGALGFVIRDSGVQHQVVQVFANFPILGMMLPYAVASILSISTGSITVALVGAASMLGPMVNSLPVSPEMAAALTGCGALCVSHANASYFWLLNRLHNAPPIVLYKTFTVQTLIMSLSGLLGVLFLYLLGIR